MTQLNKSKTSNEVATYVDSLLGMTQPAIEAVELRLNNAKRNVQYVFLRRKEGLAMTANQIKYVEYLEKKRSNRANEDISRENLQETGRHNLATETETVRHNTVGERLTAQDLDEKKRHNLAGEGLSNRDLSEKIRHNVASEQISYADLGEKTRHNKASEQISYADLSEKSRHNRASESISVADLKEKSRHNIAQESLSKTDIDERKRHNLIGELQDWQSLSEQKRHNKKSEQLSSESNTVNLFGSSASAASSMARAYFSARR